jgi:2-keto-3-deoxy-L-rhamnonate aldolase RhmA
MFRANAAKRRIREEGRAIAAWCELADPMLAEILGLSGFDAVVIDNEHGPGDLRDTVVRLQALSATPAAGLVRIPWNDPVYVKRMLDMGAEGLMFPTVNSAEEARAAVSACFYPPRGTRGAAPSILRGSDYGIATDRYMAEYQRELLVMCQIESAQAVEAIPDIAAVDGVDMLFIGPMDLSGSIGKLGRLDDPEVKALLARAERAILDSGKWWGTISWKGRTPEDLFADGCSFVVHGSDLVFVRDGALAAAAAHRRR